MSNINYMIHCPLFSQSFIPSLLTHNVLYVSDPSMAATKPTLRVFRALWGVIKQADGPWTIEHAIGRISKAGYAGNHTPDSHVYLMVIYPCVLGLDMQYRY
jgi:hypothetical protein